MEAIRNREGPGPLEVGTNIRLIFRLMKLLESRGDNDQMQTSSGVESARGDFGGGYAKFPEEPGNASGTPVHRLNSHDVP